MDLARKVYEALPEASIVEMLLSSKQFLELCELESKPGPVQDSLHGALNKRSEWLREDRLYAATVFVQRWPEHRPPSWVMDWIRQGLLDFLEEKGSLASLLGFSERASSMARRRERLLMQFVQIARLRALGLKTKEAASLVCGREHPTLRAANDSESADRLVAMTNTLAGEYHRYPGRNELTELFKLMLRKTTAEKTTAFVSDFASDFPRNEIMRIPALRKFLP